MAVWRHEYTLASVDVAAARSTGIAAVVVGKHEVAVGFGAMPNVVKASWQARSDVDMRRELKLAGMLLNF